MVMGAQGLSSGSSEGSLGFPEEERASPLEDAPQWADVEVSLEVAEGIDQRVAGPNAGHGESSVKT